MHSCFPLFSFAPLANLALIAQQIVGPFLMAHNVHQLEVFPRKEQTVEIVQVDVTALVVL